MCNNEGYIRTDNRIKASKISKTKSHRIDINNNSISIRIIILKRVTRLCSIIIQVDTFLIHTHTLYAFDSTIQHERF